MITLAPYLMETSSVSLFESKVCENVYSLAVSVTLSAPSARSTCTKTSFLAKLAITLVEPSPAIITTFVPSSFVKSVKVKPSNASRLYFVKSKI